MEPADLDAIVDEVDRARDYHHLRHAAERLILACHRLRDEAIRDPLTGVFNRRLLDARLQEELARWRRHGQVFAVLLVDLDDFKRFNDRRGHQEGDRVLRRLAGGWRSALRGADELFRYGGEEFAVLLPDADQDQAGRVAERLRLATLACGEGLTLSAGFASCPEDGTEARTLVEAADRALYHAKGTGKNRGCSSREARRKAPLPGGHLLPARDASRAELVIRLQEDPWAGRPTLVAIRDHIPSGHPGQRMIPTPYDPLQ